MSKRCKSCGEQLDETGLCPDCRHDSDEDDGHEAAILGKAKTRVLGKELSDEEIANKLDPHDPCAGLGE